MKKIIALVLALVMVMGLVACGNNATPTTNAPDAGNTPETQAPETKAPAQTEAPKAEGGCGGMIAGGVVVVALLGTALVFKKKN